MTPLTDLWLPILVSGVAVFILSAVMWMMMPHHKKDYSRLPDEDSVMKLLRGGQVTRGQYSFPHCDGHAAMKDPVWQEKQKLGPIGMLYIVPGCPNMGKAMCLSLIHNFAIATFVAYVASHALLPGSSYLSIFRIVGTTTILAYCGARFADAIWMGHTWRGVATQVFDGIVYGLVTAGIFGWLWPDTTRLDML